MDDDEHPFWDRFVEDGQCLFHRMTCEYDTMLEGDSIVKHVGFRVSGYGHIDSKILDTIKQEHGEQIQKELVPWIRSQHRGHMLFSPINWKPVNDMYVLHDMYMGYRKVFRYQQYYFQLSLSEGCHCVDCLTRRNGIPIRFEVALLGWKDDTSDKLQPNNKMLIPASNLLPYSFWKWK